MSDEEKPLEFSARDLMPDWAQETPSAPPKDFSKRFAEDEDRRDRRGGRGDDRRGGFGGRGERRDSGGGNRGGGGGGFDRGRPGGDRREGDRREGGDRRGGGGDRPARGGDRRFGDRDNRDRPREDPPAAGITAVIEPSGPAIEGLTRHIRETFRSFPVSDLAKMILEGRERYRVRFTAAEPAKLYQCQVDGSVWLTREEGIAHVLSGPALEKFYVVEDVEVGAPAGNFTSIAICGMSGTLLGPPNHHEYQRNIARLHRERFSDMSLERYKSRIRMENGEEILEKWKEQVSRARQYRVRSADEPSAVETAPEEVIEEASEESAAEGEVDSAAVEVAEGTDAGAEEGAPLEAEAETEVAESAEGGTDESADTVDEVESDDDSPAPTAAASTGPALKSMEEVSRHFRQNFADDVVREMTEAVVSGNVPGRLLSPGLLTHLRVESEKLRRSFPLPLIQMLCRDFEQKGLKFFKRGKKSLHVAAVRPKALDESVNLTEAIRNIVEFIKATPRPNVAGLLEALVPGFTKPEGPIIDESAEWSEPARVVLKDLRWLTAEGYVLEFADTGLAIGRPAQENAAPAQTQPKDKPKSDKPAKSPKPEKEKQTATAPAAAVPADAPDAPVSIPDEAVDAGSGEFADLSSGHMIDEETDPDDPNELPESVDPVETF